MLDLQKFEMEGLNTGLLESILNRKNKSRKAQSRIVEIRQIIEKLKNEEIELKNVIRAEEQAGNEEIKGLFDTSSKANTLEDSEFNEIVTAKNPFTRKKLVTTMSSEEEVETKVETKVEAKAEEVEQITSEVKTIEVNEIEESTIEAKSDSKIEEIEKNLIAKAEVIEEENNDEQEIKGKIQIPSSLIKEKSQTEIIDKQEEKLENNIVEKNDVVRKTNLSDFKKAGTTVESFLEIANKTPVEKIENFESFLKEE